MHREFEMSNETPVHCTTCSREIFRLKLPARRLEAAAQVGHADAASAFDPSIDRDAAGAR